MLAAVIGNQADQGWVLVDAGWTAMRRDRGTQDQPVDWGCGAVCNEDGTPMTDLLLSGANQGHGIVSRCGGQVRAADSSLQTWPRSNGW